MQPDVGPAVSINERQRLRRHLYAAPLRLMASVAMTRMRPDRQYDSEQVGPLGLKPSRGNSVDNTFAFPSVSSSFFLSVPAVQHCVQKNQAKKMQ